MNKADLIEVLAPRVGGRVVATQAVESLVDAILRAVAAGEGVVITGFGTFETVDRAARTGRNPRTGEPVPIGATSTPRFRPAPYFKDVVADPARLPSTGLAGVRVGSDGTAPPRGGVPASVRRDAQPSPPRARRGDRAVVAAPGSEAGGPAADPEVGGPALGPEAGGPALGQEPRVRPRRTSGTPSTVRAPAPPAPADVPTAPPAPPRGGLVTGGEEITLGVINAKKAELARVKSDEVARAGRQEAQAAAGVKAAEADKGKKGKGGKGKKSSKSGKGKAKGGKGAKA